MRDLSLQRVARGIATRLGIPTARLLGSRLQIGRGTRVNLQRVDIRDLSGCSVTIGDGSNIMGTIVLERAGATVRVGSRTHIGHGTLLDCALDISVGDDVLFAGEVLVMDHDSHSLDFLERRPDVTDWMRGKKNWNTVVKARVRVGDKAWIGARALILKGVTVGVGGVVGAGSIVTRDVPPWTLVAGNPARVIRKLPQPDERPDP